MGGMILRCRQRLASATPICHLWEWGGPGIFGIWNLGTGNIETFTHQRWDENRNPWGVSSWSSVDFRACRHHHRHWVQQVTWIPWRECRRPVNSKSFQLLLLSFFDIGRRFCASLTNDPPTDPFIVTSPCERRRWSKRMLSLENDTHRCRCRRFLLCHDCRFLPRHFWVWNPCRSRNWPTRGRNWPNSWTRHPDILKLVEVCRSFLNKNCDGKPKTFDQRSGACRILYVLYLCLYVCMYRPVYMSYSVDLQVLCLERFDQNFHCKFRTSRKYRLWGTRFSC